MSSLVDMKRSYAEKVEDSVPTPIQQDYPWGLCLHLSTDEIEKLGLDLKTLSPGDEVHFTAVAKITSVSESASVSEEANSRIELQITHMSMEKESEEHEEEHEEHDEYEAARENDEKLTERINTPADSNKSSAAYRANRMYGSY